MNLLQKLIDSGAKVNISDVLFVTKDKSGQLLWLEKGNMAAGFTHIKERHAEDFGKYLGLQRCSDTLPINLIRSIVTDGEIISEESGKKGGINKVYRYQGDYFIIAGIGTNGFIVTVFPDERRNHERKEKSQNSL